MTTSTCRKCWHPLSKHEGDECHFRLTSVSRQCVCAKGTQAPREDDRVPEPRPLVVDSLPKNPGGGRPKQTRRRINSYPWGS